MEICEGDFICWVLLEVEFADVGMVLIDWVTGFDGGGEIENGGLCVHGEGFLSGAGPFPVFILVKGFCAADFVERTDLEA